MMRARCNTPSTTGYKYYGGRGIRVCERWDDFSIFAEDMGPKPSPKYTLDRIHRDIDYCPNNCVWATRTEQSRNRPTYNCLNEEIAAEIRKRYSASDTGLRRLAREFDAAVSTIHSVVHGRTWKL
mgnify:CR=1 FL=1